MWEAPAGNCIGRQESASFQCAVGRRPFQRPSAKKERLKDYTGHKVVGAFVQIAPRRRMSMAKNSQPARGTAASAPPHLGYGIPTRQERGQILSFATTFLCATMKAGSWAMPAVSWMIPKSRKIEFLKYFEMLLATTTAATCEPPGVTRMCQYQYGIVHARRTN